MASKSKMKDCPFTNFTIKVNVESSWQTTVKKVLKSVKGVTNFRMENDGRINISGYIEPNVLLDCLRKAGKDARLVNWQYGDCSSNLYERRDYGYNNSYANNYGYNNGYGSYTDYGYNNYGYNNNGCSGSEKNAYSSNSNPRSFDDGPTCSLM